ncbi:MAG: hypothetical protein C0467_31430 [Planctomycetaceae bacterium]|nr:hypothetical protein [Planctomycetaceae bacterium]
MNQARWFGLFIWVLAFAGNAPGVERPAFIDAESALEARFGPAWADQPTEQIARELVSLAESLPVGGAIDLPITGPCGTLDFRRVADDVQVTGGWGGTIVFGGGQCGLQLMFSRCDQFIAEGVARPASKLRTPGESVAFVSARGGPGEVFGPRVEPATDLFALFNRGAIRIKADVKNCAWICGDNAFGKRTVTAEARVDGSLFLWLGLNWPFLDYNAHWNPKNAKRDWAKENAQLWFDLKGGGKGTRLYELIETNYGNPGSGAVFLNCKDLAVYHGSTERGSSQGPGVYWLKDCERVQLGIRGINAFGSNNGDPRAADAARDITIEGGRGNILHAMRTWSNANEVSLWNSDPELQQWMVGSQYGRACGHREDAAVRGHAVPRAANV